MTTPGKTAVAKLASGTTRKASRKGRRRPRRSPYTAKTIAPSETIRVMAKTRLISPSVMMRALLAKGKVVEMRPPE